MARADRRPLLPRHVHGAGGYTLIEVMIALAILAIVASLAVPAFFDSIRKSRRGEAVVALSAVQQSQEQWRANRSTYTTDLAALKQSSPTVNGLYEITIDAAGATSYTVTAKALGAQAKDSRCASMRVQVSGGNIVYGSACSSCDFGTPLTDPHRCWSRR